MTSLWGPRVWSLLHRLSFYSNRQDVGGAWKNVLRTLNDVIPCALCRNHMKEYMNKNPLLIPSLIPGTQVREIIVVWLYNFHNHVNVSLGRDPFPFEMLEVMYGQGSYESAVSDAKRLLGELDGIWASVQSREWRLASSYLCSLIIGGPL
jgi:hypothetical protein